MPRAINAKIDALFVEGPDDGAVVNAFVKKLTGTDLSRRPHLIRTDEHGGGVEWALCAFDRHVAAAHVGARVGLIIDRDGIENRPDNWPKVSALLARLGGVAEGPRLEGHIVHGRFGIWMWPDNVTVGGDLETFVAGVVPASPVLEYAANVSRAAKQEHGAEYELAHARKAALKVRSVWRDASAAGGYGHLVRNLPLEETHASRAFLAWFRELFLT
jgi:hypothetical protein